MSYSLEEVESLLLCGQQLTDDEIASLKCLLGLMKADHLRSSSKCLGVRLTGAVWKGDITERLLGMAWIGAISNRDTSNDNTSDVPPLYHIILGRRSKKDIKSVAFIF